ncbi:hypothetical protein ORI20_30805 [Mycobacterium sp. CVI_P3]|uniref:hypothetical protein n=1 Tax=Mycobacterium pinniadriaticum TaxID=2994102 RepID=UPI0022490770|nr:hypothetical protein [Mycobacterium pinniadriaticum]MCX2934663.1 hypothetical protein [Mycobacterium pinniadriaticum]
MVGEAHAFLSQTGFTLVAAVGRDKVDQQFADRAEVIAVFVTAPLPMSGNERHQ